MISCSRAYLRPRVPVTGPPLWLSGAPEKQSPGLDRTPELMCRFLDAIDDGLILTDATARIIHANHAARQLLKIGPLTVRHGQLGAQVGGETRALQDLIAACARGFSGEAALKASGPSRGDDILLLVAAAGEPGANGSGVIVLARPLGRLSLPSPAVIGSVFGLTPAEARLALELMKGDGLKPCAKRLGVTPATARTHLNRVFEKTGTKRQAELVRLLVSCRLPEARRPAEADELG